MLFPTVTFAIFFVIVFAVSWAIRPNAVAWKLFILGASLVFYGWWDYKFVSLIGASILANYLVAQAITMAAGPRGEWTRASKLLVGAGVALNLVMLGWFKYYGFFATDVVNAFNDIGIGVSLPLMQVTLPVGVSFFTFHGISYLVDIGRGELRPLSLLNFSVYMAFFPHLVAGPIVRGTELGPQLENLSQDRYIESGEGFRLIISGLFKKVVISSYLATELADPVFALPGEHSSAEILIGLYAYAIQIYADFSGYTDIAIGCALLLGIRMPKNFDSPYRATSIQEFWRRWHMTLSRWLRDYLYIPLGGSRKGRIFTYRNLMITMVLGGLWHGAAWTFIIWGAIIGAGLCIERLLRNNPQYFPIWSSIPASIRPAIGWFLTFHTIVLGWVFFRATSVDSALEILKRLFTEPGDAPLVTPVAVLVIAGSLAIQFIPEGFYLRLQQTFSQMPPVTQAAALGISFFLIERLGPEGVAPFIYFQF